MILYYVRHGDPIYDPDGLTELGFKQADALVDRFKLYGLDEIYVSSSNRARLTAEPTCKALNITPTVLDWTNERHAWEELTVKLDGGGKTWVFYDKEYLSRLNRPEVLALGKEWYTHPLFKDYDFGGGVHRIERETDDFLATLGFKHERGNNRYQVLKKNEKRVALFAHQGFGIAFLSAVLDIPYPYICTHFDLSHSSVTPILFSGENGEYIYPKTLQVANDSHLFKKDILTGYNNGIKV